MRKYFEFWEEDGRIGEWREYYGAELVGEFIEVTGIEKSAEGEWYISNMAAEGTEADLEDEDAFQMWVLDHDTYGWSCGGYETLEQAIAENNLEGDEMVQFIAKRIEEAEAQGEAEDEPKMQLNASVTTETYDFGDEYRVDIVTFEDHYESWFYHKDIGIKTHLYGMPKGINKEDYLDIVQTYIDENDIIDTYKDEYMTDF